MTTQKELRSAEMLMKSVIPGYESPFDDDDYAEQHGVKGMKWGVRKTRSASVKKARKEKPAKPKEVQAERKRKVKEMSDADLRNALSRLQMEKQYAQLMAPDKSRGVIREVLATSGKQIALNTITQVGTAYVSNAIGVNLNKALPEAYAVKSKK